MALLEQWEEGLKAPAQAGKYGRLVAARLGQQGRQGALLKYLQQVLAEPTASKLEKELEKELRETKQQTLQGLGWAHVLANQASWKHLDNPPVAALF